MGLYSTMQSPFQVTLIGQVANLWETLLVVPFDDIELLYEKQDSSFCFAAFRMTGKFIVSPSLK